MVKLLLYQNGATVNIGSSSPSITPDFSPERNNRLDELRLRSTPSQLYYFLLRHLSSVVNITGKDS